MTIILNIIILTINTQTSYLSFFLHKCNFGLNFSPHENCINFAYMATFSTSHTCQMWRISDFSTSVMGRHLKFLHMQRIFLFPCNRHTWKAENSPHGNFFSTYIICDIGDKYEVWNHAWFFSVICYLKFMNKHLITIKIQIMGVTDIMMRHSISFFDICCPIQ